MRSQTVSSSLLIIAVPLMFVLLIGCDANSTTNTMEEASQEEIDDYRQQLAESAEDMPAPTR